jgi:hypothetical protein
MKRIFYLLILYILIAILLFCKQKVVLLWIKQTSLFLCKYSFSKILMREQLLIYEFYVESVNHICNFSGDFSWILDREINWQSG